MSAQKQVNSPIASQKEMILYKQFAEIVTNIYEMSVWSASEKKMYAEIATAFYKTKCKELNLRRL